MIVCVCMCVFVRAWVDGCGCGCGCGCGYSDATRCDAGVSRAPPAAWLATSLKRGEARERRDAARHAATRPTPQTTPPLQLHRTDPARSLQARAAAPARHARRCWWSCRPARDGFHRSRYATPPPLEPVAACCGLLLCCCSLLQSVPGYVRVCDAPRRAP